MNKLKKFAQYGIKVINIFATESGLLAFDEEIPVDKVDGQFLEQQQVLYGVCDDGEEVILLSADYDDLRKAYYGITGIDIGILDSTPCVRQAGGAMSVGHHIYH